MSINNWKKIEKVFHATLDLPMEERKSYLQKICAGDGELFSEIESLVNSFQKESYFLDEPVFELGLSALYKHGGKNFTGMTIGFYKLQEKIGTGGMGEVYKAVDSRLNRYVALKFLSESLENDPAAKRQLVKEAQAVAALEHPNICAVHGIEQTSEHHFIVMQYIDGKTLADEIIEKEIISVEEFKSLACQIVSAVAFSHSHGVIHRDLKPGNIMLTAERQIKVLDFGLAKIIRQKQLLEGEIDSRSNFSQNGLVIGTVSYMSPEQLRGEKIDYQSDIFSIGIILYELLTKKNPFIRKSQAETIAAILSDEPPALKKIAPDFPMYLIDVVEKCLKTDSEKRFQSAAEILVELNKTGSKNYQETRFKRRRRSFIKTALAAIGLLAVFAIGYYLSISKPAQRTLVIMPISFEASQGEKKYLANGLTQSIIDKLSGLSGLGVKNESLVARYKGKAIDPVTVGKELNVDAVFVGNIEKRAEELVLNTKLIRISDGAIIDANKSKIDETKLIESLESITSRILDKIQLIELSESTVSRIIAKIKPELMKTEKDTESEDAERLYLLGRFYLKSRKSNETLTKAIRSFTDAKDIDQKYAKAWAGLADAYLFLSAPGAEGAIPPKRAVELAKESAKKAVGLDNNLCEAYHSLGLISLRYDWDWNASESYFRAAINRNPEFLPSRSALVSLLSLQGRFDEAIEEAEKIKTYDPVSISSDIETAFAYYRKKDFEQTDKILTDLQQRFPENREVIYLQVYNFLMMGKLKEATEILEKIYKSDKVEDKISVAAPLGFAYAKAGRREDALKVIEDLEEFRKNIYVPAQEDALIYVGLGDYDKVFRKLNESCNERFSSLPGWITEPIVDEVKSDPRFAKIRECVNLN